VAPGFWILTPPNNAVFARKKSVIGPNLTLFFTVYCSISIPYLGPTTRLPSKENDRSPVGIQGGICSHKLRHKPQRPAQGFRNGTKKWKLCLHKNSGTVNELALAVVLVTQDFMLDPSSFPWETQTVKSSHLHREIQHGHRRYYPPE